VDLEAAAARCQPAASLQGGKSGSTMRADGPDCLRGVLRLSVCVWALERVTGSRIVWRRPIG